LDSLEDGNDIDYLDSLYQQQRRKNELALLIMSMKLSPEDIPDGGNMRWFDIYKAGQNLLFVDQKVPQAAAVFKKAADLGCSDANILLAAIHELGIGIETDWDLVLKCYQKAADLGNLNGLILLAEAYEHKNDFKNMIAIWNKTINKVFADYKKDPKENRPVLFAVAALFIEKIIDNQLEIQAKNMVEWLKQMKDDISTHIKAVNYSLSHDYGDLGNLLDNYLENKEEKLRLIELILS